MTWVQRSTALSGVIEDLIVMVLNKDPRNVLELHTTDENLSDWVLMFRSTFLNFSDSIRGVAGTSAVTYSWDTPGSDTPDTGDDFSISENQVLDISITGMACEP